MPADRISTRLGTSPPRARGLDKRRTILCGCEEQYNRGCKERNYAQREEERARFICYKLLVVNKNDPRGREFVSVAYDGDTYWVPGDEQGNSFAVFETVHQLLALAKVAKDLPPTAILSVSPIP